MAATVSPSSTGTQGGTQSSSSTPSASQAASASQLATLSASQLSSGSQTTSQTVSSDQAITPGSSFSQTISLSPTFSRATQLSMPRLLQQLSTPERHCIPDPTADSKPVALHVIKHLIFSHAGCICVALVHWQPRQHAILEFNSLSGCINVLVHNMYQQPGQFAVYLSCRHSFGFVDARWLRR